MPNKFINKLYEILNIIILCIITKFNISFNLPYHYLIKILLSYSFDENIFIYYYI